MDAGDDKYGSAATLSQDAPVIIQELFEALERKRRSANLLTAALKESPDACAELGKALESLGIRKPVTAAGMGTNAIGFVTSSRQFVRLCDEAPLADLPPTVLAPLATYRPDLSAWGLRNFRIDVMPEVKVGEITDDEIVTLIKNSLAHNFLFWDVKQANIGRLADGTPIILDPGAVVPCDKAVALASDQNYGDYLSSPKVLRWIAKVMADMHDVRAPVDNILNYLREVGYDNYFAALKKWAGKSSIDYAAAQANHRAHFGLETGKVNGVIPASEIEILRDNNPESSLANAMIEGRHDDASWKAAVMKSVMDTDFAHEQWTDGLKKHPNTPTIRK